jgi:putative membrane protein
MIVVRLNGSKFEPVGDGLLFWFLILDPRPRPPARLSYPVRLILVMAIHVLQIMAGALLALAPQDLYPFYSLCGRLYPAFGLRFDQALGGFVVYLPGAMMSAIAGLILFQWLWNAESGLSIAVSARVGTSDGTVLVPLLKDPTMF